MTADPGRQQLGPNPFAFSVVMPVYAKANPEHLESALASVYGQTLPPSEVVVVEDGPLMSAHEQVLAGYEDRHPRLLRLRLARNSGVAAALQTGIQAAKSPWIARMDADDIAVSSRFERQMKRIQSGHFDVVGSAMVEFDVDESSHLGVRRMPEDHESIVRLLRLNNAFNHPTVVFQRSLVVKVGGYQELPHLEDYDLWARVWAAGGVFHNLREPLVLYRAGDNMLARRRLRGIHRAEWRLQRNLRMYGLISRPQAVRNLVVRTSFRLLPTSILRLAYRRMFYDTSRNP